MNSSVFRKPCTAVLCATCLLGVATAQEPVGAKLSPGRFYALWTELIENEAGGCSDRLADCERMAATAPDNHRVWYALAEGYAAAGRSQDAIAAFQRTREIGTEYPEYMAAQISALYAAEGDRDSALHWLDIALAERRPLARLAREDAFQRFADDPAFIERLGMPFPDIIERDAQWVYDLRLLRREARRMRIGVHGAPIGTGFDTELDALVDNVAGLSDNEIWLAARRIVANISDGHTFLGGPRGKTPRHFDTRTLPVTFFDFDDGLYIVNATEAFEVLIGSRVVKIGHMDRDMLISAVDEYTQEDNTRTVRYIGAQLNLRRAIILRGLGLTDGTNAIRLSLESPGGEAHDVELRIGDFRVSRKIAPASRQVPMHLRHVATEDARNYWRQRMFDHTMYVQLNSMRDNQAGPDLAAFAAGLKEDLATSEFRTVIVDLRHNNGGDAALAHPLLRVLLSFEEGGADHQVFVITSHMTFSAAQIFASRLDALGRPVFVGTPTASSPNFIGEEEVTTLPYCRLDVSFSPLYWQNTTPIDHRGWIEIAVPVPYRGSDYIAGRDAALDAILHICATPGTTK